MPHRISIERNTLRFAAAHFTTAGGECEPLHGHNYDVMVQIDGALSEDAWVVDFAVAKRIVRRLCKELDHRFLLAALNPALRVDETDEDMTIGTSDNRRYVIPRGDIAALEIDNTTAERLAEWFARRIAVELAAAGAANVTSITVGVEEMPGQAGWFTLAPGA
jgi:6-pyruvoyltetrahydropterin/6-carboxytetrahydropterin synthase